MAKMLLGPLVAGIKGSIGATTFSNTSKGLVASQKRWRVTDAGSVPTYGELLRRIENSNQPEGKAAVEPPTLEELWRVNPFQQRAAKELIYRFCSRMTQTERRKYAEAIVRVTYSKADLASIRVHATSWFPDTWNPIKLLFTNSGCAAIVERYLMRSLATGVTNWVWATGIFGFAAATSVGVAYANLHDFTIPMYVQALRLDKLANGLKFLAGYVTGGKGGTGFTPPIDLAPPFNSTTHLIVWYKVTGSATSNSGAHGWRGGRSLGAGLGPIVDLAKTPAYSKECLFNGHRIWIVVATFDTANGGMSYCGQGFVGGKA